MTVIEMELAELRRRVERLEEAMRRLEGDGHRTEALALEGLSERERLLAELKAEGLIRDPTPYERRLAAEWDSLSEDEKHSQTQMMHSLVLDPPLSDIILQNRQ